MTLRLMVPADIPAGMRLSRAAGWNQMEDDWRFFFQSPGSGGFVSEKNGHLVGTVAFVRYDSFAWIAMMLVDPAERRAGIGAKLMDHALSALSDCPCVGLDATPMGEPLYHRLGFVKQCAMVRTKAIVEAGRFETTGRARPMRQEDLSAILPYDRETFGADRSQLLASLLERAPECAWINVGRGHAPSSYCFGRPGRLFHHLGPIVAADRGAAQDLVTDCLSKLTGPIAIDASRLDDKWIAWLASVGFAEERPFARMFRDTPQHPGVPAHQYAITGPEFA